MTRRFLPAWALPVITGFALTLLILPAVLVAAFARLLAASFLPFLG
jgi:hypothetical protein